jgi:flagellar export protein FliJ
MAKFVFQLDPALRARVACEKQAMAKLAQVEREKLAMEEQLRGVHSAIEDLRESQRRTLSGTRDGSGAREAGVALRSAALEAAMAAKLRMRADQLVLKLAGVHARVERAREELRKAATERKSVEQMRELRLHEWRQEQNRLESATLDDISQIRGGQSGQGMQGGPGNAHDEEEAA